MTKEIDANNRRFADALVRGDAADVAAVYAPDARLLAPGAEPIQGREAIEAFWKGGVEMGIKGVELETLELEQQDGVAYEIGRYRLRIEPDGAEGMTDVGKFVVVHKRQLDGSWKWAVDIFNSDAPA